MHPRAFIPFILFTLSFFYVPAQNKNVVDSLQKLLSNPTILDTTLVKVYNDLGIEFSISDPKRAKNYIRKALKVASAIKRPRGMAGAYNCFGIVHYYQKEYDSALIYFKKAFDLNKEIGHLWGQASAPHQIAATQNLLTDYNNAINSFKDSGAIFKQLNDSISYTKSIENIGVSYSLMKHSKEALEHFILANSLYEKLQNISGIGRTYIHISNVYIEQKEYKKGLEYLNKALPIIKEGGNKVYLGNILKNIGICYNGLENYDKALIVFEQSLDLWHKHQNLKRIASIQSLIGETYYEMGSYSQALIYQQHALNNYIKKGEINDKTVTTNLIAKSFLHLKQIDSSKLYAEKALLLSKSIKNIVQEKKANQTLALIAEQEGNSVAAYMYYKNISKLKDSLDILQKKEQLRELQTRFETNKKNQQINALAQLNQQTQKKYQLQLILLAISILISGITIFIFRKKFKLSCLEKKLLSDELKTKKKQLTTHSLYLAKKNKVLENLKEEVELIQFSEDQNAQYNYQKLLQTINFDMKEDQDWDNFKRYFEEVHQDFYSNIKKKYPDVSSNELRLMALLKMNLSSKEIGRILNITQEGVRKARYRLRKKLEIDSNDKLIELIFNI